MNTQNIITREKTRRIREALDAFRPAADYSRRQTMALIGHILFRAGAEEKSGYLSFQADLKAFLRASESAQQMRRQAARGLAGNPLTEGDRERAYLARIRARAEITAAIELRRACKLWAAEKTRPQGAEAAKGEKGAPAAKPAPDLSILKEKPSIEIGPMAHGLIGSRSDMKIAIFDEMAAGMGITDKASYLRWRDGMRADLTLYALQQRARRESLPHVKAASGQEAFEAARRDILIAGRSINLAHRMREAGKLWSARRADEARSAKFKRAA